MAVQQDKRKTRVPSVAFFIAMLFFVSVPAATAKAAFFSAVATAQQLTEEQQNVKTQSTTANDEIQTGTQENSTTRFTIASDKSLDEGNRKIHLKVVGDESQMEAQENAKPHLALWGQHSQLENQESSKTPSSIGKFEREAEQSWDFGAVGSAWKTFIDEVLRIEPLESEEKWPEPSLGRKIAAAILSFVTAGLCSATGLGGGALFVPIVNLVLQFSAKTSAALSNFLIMGGTVVGVALNLLRDRRSGLSKPLVDFDIALLLQPNLLLGVSIGVILNRVFPNWMITALLTIALVYMAVHTVRVGLKRWATENRKAAEKGKGKRGSNSGRLRRSNTETERALSESLLGYYKFLASRYPAKKIVALLFVWLVMFALQILLGGHEIPSLAGIEECGVIYWLVSALQIPVAFGVTAWVIYRIPEPSSETVPGTSDSQEQEKEFELGRKEGISLSGTGLLAGLLGGMLGVGGAMIINPMLLSAGVLPQVTAATTLLVILFSTTMSLAQYWIIGSIPIAYALVGALICGISSAIGILGLQRMINKFRRPSLIVFVEAIVLVSSALLMCVFGSWEIWNQHKAGAYMGFTYPC